MDMVEESFVPTVLSHNRDRLIVHDVAGEFLIPPFDDSPVHCRRLDIGDLVLGVSRGDFFHVVHAATSVVLRRNEPFADRE
jgi:hypothetical protein